MLTLGETIALDSGLEQRADGLVAIPFVLTATGVHAYQIGGKRVRVLKNADHFHTDSYLQSARSAPVTVEHPRVAVTPDSKDLIVGLGFEQAARVEGHKVLHGATLFDTKAIAEVSNKRIRAVSAGFHTTLVENSGVFTDSSGNKHEYDAIQTRNRINHIALTAAPRVPESSILFDSSNELAIWLPEEKNPLMDDIKQLLSQLVSDSKLDEKASTALGEALDAHKSQIAELNKELGELRAKLAEAEKNLEAAPTMDSLQEAHNSRIELAALIADSCELPLVDVVKLGDERSMYAAALEKLGHEIAADANVDVLSGMFSVAAKAPKESPKSAAAALKSVEAPKSLSSKMADLHAADLERNRKGC